MNKSVKACGGFTKTEALAGTLKIKNHINSGVRMKKVIFAAAIALSAVIFAGCKTKGVDLVSGDWNLIQYNIEENAIALQEASVSFVSEGKELKVSGFSGVNLFSGSSAVSGNKISLNEDFASTKMAGSQEEMEFERKFLNSLGGADRLEVKSEGEKKFLHIFNSTEKSELVFESTSIKDSEWILAAILKGDGVVSLNTDKNERPSLKFTEKGKAAGFSGLNYFTADCRLDEKSRKISFTPDASTLMAGDKDSMELETLFFESIEKAFSYSISGKNLTVYSKDGKILLEFIRA